MTVQLYKHQLEALNYYHTRNAVLNLSEPGTGKSASTCRFIEQIEGKAVVVAPAFLCKNWQREFEKFTDIKAAIYPKRDKVTIISYGMIHKAPEIFRSLHVLVADEIHYCSSHKTLRTKTLHHCVKDMKPLHFIGLTGTALKNRVPELWSLLTLMDYMIPRGFQKAFRSHWSFCNTFCNSVSKRFGGQVFTTFEGVRNLEELSKWMTGISFKHYLKDLKDVPDVIFNTIEVVTAKPQDKFLDNNLKNAWDLILEGNVTAAASSAKKENAILKAPSTSEIAIDLLQQGQESLVIFTDHIDSAVIIRDNIRHAKYSAEMIRGDVSMKDRDAIVQQFQGNKLNVIIGTIGAMGTGVTLTAAHTCVFNDLSWIPASNTQAYGRIQRIGQKEKCIVIDVVRDGIDSQIHKMLRQKEALIKEVQFT